MKYLLFGGSECCYASGGSHDFLDGGGNLEALTTFVEERKYIDWWHIFNTETREIVTGSKVQPYGADNLPYGLGT